MKEIIERYRGVETPKKHELRVDEHDGKITIWSLFWDEYEGVDEHHHMGVARISPIENGFEIDWFRGVDQEPYKSEQVTDLSELFSKIDSEIANR